MDNVHDQQSMSNIHSSKNNHDDREAEEYWHNHVASNVSQKQIDFFAEQSFCRLWNEKGIKAAEDVLFTQTDHQHLLQVAEQRFNDGCELWGQGRHEQALYELQRSRDIRETHLQPQSMMFFRGGTRGQLPSSSQIESHAQLFYATGTVHLSLGDHSAALLEFRRALQVSGIALGIEYHLTEASMYMIRTVLLTMGHTSLSIKS